MIFRVAVGSRGGRSPIARRRRWRLDSCGHRGADSPLLYGLELFAAADRGRLDRLLRSEKLLILWRSARLTDLDRAVARCVVAECAEGWSQLQAEVELRLTLDGVPTTPFALTPGDTLKRALHRALVHIDQLDPPPDDLLTTVVSRGLELLESMTFVCPSTAYLWARNARRWIADHATDHLPVADQAMSAAQQRMARAAEASLATFVGPPAPRDSPDSSTLGHEHTQQMMALLRRAPEVMEVAADGH